MICQRCLKNTDGVHTCNPTALVRKLEAENAELKEDIAAYNTVVDDGKMFVLAMASRVCRLLPPGWEMRLCMENGAGWVTLHNPDGDCIATPDSADKSLEQQVDDALRVARKW